MEQSLPLPIMNRATTMHTVRRYSVSFVVSIAWLLYSIIVAYVKKLFRDEDYSIRVFPMMIIMFYQIYYLLRGFDIRRYKLNLVGVYFAYIVLHYLLLQSGLERVISLIATLTGLMLLIRYPLTKKEIRKLYYVFALVVLLKIANGATVENMEDTSKFNPNECAIYLMMLFCISLLMFAYKKRIIFLIIATVCFALQFYFTSRGALVGCILFFAAFVLFKAWRKNCKANTAFILIFSLSVLGILLAYFYSAVLYEKIGKGNVTILGKDLFSGRQGIWTLTFDLIKENLWFGVGSHVNEEAVLATSNGIYRNAHNMALAVLVSFGLLHFILFYLLLSHLVANGRSCCTKKGKYVSMTPVIFMCVITLMNYFEVLFYHQWAVPMVIVAYGFIYNCQCVYGQKCRSRQQRYKQVRVG